MRREWQMPTCDGPGLRDVLRMQEKAVHDKGPHSTYWWRWMINNARNGEVAMYVTSWSVVRDNTQCDNFPRREARFIHTSYPLKLFSIGGEVARWIIGGTLADVGIE
jgi:hypothetical protein